MFEDCFAEHDEDLLSETYPLCEACAHKVALALKSAEDLVPSSGRRTHTHAHIYPRAHIHAYTHADE
jgi:hypothetical protein